MMEEERPHLSFIASFKFLLTLKKETLFLIIYVYREMDTLSRKEILSKWSLPLLWRVVYQL